MADMPHGVKRCSITRAKMLDSILRPLQLTESDSRTDDLGLPAGQHWAYDAVVIVALKLRVFCKAPTTRRPAGI
jgi:hypothetical protein